MLVNGEKARKTLNVNVIPSKEGKRLNVKRYGDCGEINKARHLVAKFERLGYPDAENCLGFFIKCFKRLPESAIWEYYEGATNNPQINSAIKYFIGVCRNQMRTTTG